MSLRLALAQINPTVGDLTGNREKVLAWLDQARQQGADLVLFPEMVVTGYPPEDLLFQRDFVADAMATLHEIAAATRDLTAVVGTVWAEDDLYNAAAVLHDGEIAALYYKQHLPNYGVFDENRYFRAGRQRLVFTRDHFTFGVTICEDIWYPEGPAQQQASAGGAELLLNISASPFSMGKLEARERMLATRAADNIAFVAYCNLVGGQDELVFDGHSLAFSPAGELLARGRQFAEELLLVDLDPVQVSRRRLQDPRRRQMEQTGAAEFRRVALRPLTSYPKQELAPPRLASPLEPVAQVYEALKMGTADYVSKNGFRRVVLGLSGGVDSALVATIAADALGPENVTGVAMPTRYSSAHSLEDAELLARNLGIHFLTLPIDDVFQAFLDLLAPQFAGLPSDVTEENIQPRVRGTVLMALSNKFGWLVLTTGNKSEIGVGYCTLYGDTAGGFAVLKDVPKTLVYRLCHYRNGLAGRDLIPQRVLEKPPSAELRPDQRDSDSLPEYEVLDPIVHAFVEENCAIEEIVRRGFDPATVRRVVEMVERSEYKRRQSPPGVKITPRAFGKDWRLPITNRYSRNVS